jgi:hypothetical protein
MFDWSKAFTKGKGMWRKAETDHTPTNDIGRVQYHLIQYKKVVVPGKDKNDLTSNDAMCHKWGYLVSKKIQTELNGE